MTLDDDLERRLLELEGAGLRRRRETHDGLLDFASNDYLGLGSRVRTNPPAAGSARASRLVRGESQEVTELEDGVARWLQAEAALVFSSGYAANLGLLGALAGPGDLIVSDALNHASIVDGCRLSRAEVVVAPHLRLEVSRETLRAHRALGRGRRFLVTESYFGMDADRPNLAELRRLADETGAALLVDEAHALGVFGPGGRGLLAAEGVRADALMGTFGKALGGSGAFVAGSTRLVDWLWNRARSFVFSTGVAPATAVHTLAGLNDARVADGLRERLQGATARVRATLAEVGLSVLGDGPLLPILVPGGAEAIALQSRARAAGLHLQAIRPPTASPRLRVSLHADHTEEERERLIHFWKIQART